MTTLVSNIVHDKYKPETHEEHVERVIKLIAVGI